MLEQEQQNKLETLGLLAGSVAHDLNNILTGILGNISLLQAMLQDRPDCNEYLTALETSARKSADITGQILEFVRGNVMRREQVNIVAIVRDIIRDRQVSAPSEIFFEFNCANENFSVLGDCAQIHQIILNLIVNAQNALDGKGNVVIDLKCMHLNSDLSAYNLNIPAADYILLTITDNGSGISDDILNKIFDPFFTTKDKKGTGLGMAIVHSFVKQHHGLVNVRSKIGEGTVFEIYFPQNGKCDCCEKKIAKPHEEKKSLIPRGSERILVVDDEDTVRMVLQKSLEFLGYKVDVAIHGKNALETYSNQLQHYDLVILDMMMPYLSGEETFIKMQEIRSDIKVILASGYSDADSTRKVLALGAKTFIQKPFAIEDLAVEVRKAIDSTL